MGRTVEAYFQWEHDWVRACAQAKLAEHARIAQSELIVAKSELEEVKSQLPVVVRMGVEVYTDTRYGSSNEKKDPISTFFDVAGLVKKKKK